MKSNCLPTFFPYIHIPIIIAKVMKLLSICHVRISLFMTVCRLYQRNCEMPYSSDTLKRHLMDWLP
jgi:hypothetical protein